MERRQVRVPELRLSIISFIPQGCQLYATYRPANPEEIFSVTYEMTRLFEVNAAGEFFVALINWIAVAIS